MSTFHYYHILLQICIATLFIWRFVINEATRNSRIVLTFTALFIFEYELFRLNMAKHGFPLPELYRFTLVQYEWLFIGLYWREVILCYENYRDRTTL